MQRISTCAAVAAVAFNTLIVGSTIAQSRPDPTDPQLRVPAVEYVSPFASYQRYQEEKPASWRALNDEVLGLGGHAGHIKDGASSGAKPAAVPERSSPRSATASESTPPQPASAPSAGPSTHKH